MKITLKPSENVKFYFQLGQKPWGLGPGTSHAVTSNKNVHAGLHVHVYPNPRCGF